MNIPKAINDAERILDDLFDYYDKNPIPPSSSYTVEQGKRCKDEYDTRLMKFCKEERPPIFCGLESRQAYINCLKGSQKN